MLGYSLFQNFRSPLTTHIANCTKSALQTLLGVLLVGNTLTGVNVLGIVLTILGSSLYSMDRYYSLEASKSGQSAQGPAAASSLPPPPPAAPVTPIVKVKVAQLPGAGVTKPRKLF